MENTSLSEFFFAHRKAILVVAAVIGLAAAGTAGFFIVYDVVDKKNIAGLEELAGRYSELSGFFVPQAADATTTADAAADTADAPADTGSEQEGAPAPAIPVTAEQHAEVDKLLEDISKFADKASGYTGARAWSMAGDIYAGREKWADAETAYINSAKKAGKNFLAPVSFFNAAVCAEESGKQEDAKTYWSKSLNFDDFPLAPRAQFSLARILETEGKTEEALAAYRLLIEKYEKETEWTNLAHSRIIVLEQE